MSRATTARFATITAALAAVAALLAAPAEALAQPAVDLGPISGGQPGASGAEQVQQKSYWALGTTRTFVAATVDAGFLYLRPQLAFGYGKPHVSWIGAEFYPSVSGGGMVEYGGIRGVLPYLDVRFGARYLFTFGRRFLQPREMYTRDDVETRFGPRSRYVSLDAEIAFTIPAWHGSAFGLASAFTILGVPKGMYVFEEALKTAIKPPLITRGRLGYVFRVGPGGDITLGAFGEALFAPARPQAIVRAGPIAGLLVSDHIELIATFAFVIRSEDKLGLASGDIGQLGLRYRWASGEPVPVSLIP